MENHFDFLKKQILEVVNTLPTLIPEDQKAAANATYVVFTSYLMAGFTEDQATTIIAKIITFGGQKNE